MSESLLDKNSHNKTCNTPFRHSYIVLEYQSTLQAKSPTQAFNIHYIHSNKLFNRLQSKSNFFTSCYIYTKHIYSFAKAKILFCLSKYFIYFSFLSFYFLFATFSFKLYPMSVLFATSQSFPVSFLLIFVYIFLLNFGNQYKISQLGMLLWRLLT